MNAFDRWFSSRPCNEGKGDASSSSNLALKHGTIHFLIAQVSEEELEHIPGYIGRVVEIVMSNGGTVTTVFSSLVVSTFGFPFDQPHSEPKDVTQALLFELRDQVRVLYGKCQGFYGNVGSATCVHFGPILPNSAELLISLSQLNMGESKAIIPET